MQRPVRIGACCAALAIIVSILAIATTREVTVLVLDVPDRQATLLVRHSPAVGMRLIESEASLCARQRPGSPLHSVSLPASFCPLALARSPLTNGANVLFSLPFVKALHGLVAPRWRA